MGGVYAPRAPRRAEPPRTDRPSGACDAHPGQCQSRSMRGGRGRCRPRTAEGPRYRRHGWAGSTFALDCLQHALTGHSEDRRRPRTPHRRWASCLTDIRARRSTSRAVTPIASIAMGTRHPGAHGVDEARRHHRGVSVPGENLVPEGTFSCEPRRSSPIGEPLELEHSALIRGIPAGPDASRERGACLGSIDVEHPPSLPGKVPAVDGSTISSDPWCRGPTEPS